MKALISDIHGNLEALTAVFEDIDAHNVTDVYFLGDVVGYGPDPEKCIDMLEKRCSVHLLGNHDHAMLNAPIGFNPIARGAIECLRARMEPGNYSMPWKRRRWRYLGDLKLRHLDEDILFVHASPRDPVLEYVLPTDPDHNPEKIDAIFARVERLCFVGHTHMPGVFTEEPCFYKPSEIEYSYTIGPGKAVINIGSVGQPRDRDTRACYVLLDDDNVTWRRVEYDFEKTMKKIDKVECLDNRCGVRLAYGR